MSKIISQYTFVLLKHLNFTLHSSHPCFLCHSFIYRSPQLWLKLKNFSLVVFLFRVHSFHLSILSLQLISHSIQILRYSTSHILFWMTTHLSCRWFISAFHQSVGIRDMRYVCITLVVTLMELSILQECLCRIRLPARRCHWLMGCFSLLREWLLLVLVLHQLLKFNRSHHLRSRSTLVLIV